MRAYLPTAVAPAGRRHRSVWRTPQAVPGGPYRASRPRCRPATTPTGEPPAPPNPPPTGEDGRPRAATNWWHQGSRPPRGPAAQGPRRQLASEARHRPPAAAARSHQLVTAAQTPGAPPPTGRGAPRPPAPANLRQQLVRPHRRLASRPPPPPTGHGAPRPPAPARHVRAGSNWPASGPRRAPGPPTGGRGLDRARHRALPPRFASPVGRAANWPARLVTGPPGAAMPPAAAARPCRLPANWPAGPAGEGAGAVPAPPGTPLQAPGAAGPVGGRCLTQI